MRFTAFCESLLCYWPWNFKANRAYVVIRWSKAVSELRAVLVFFTAPRRSRIGKEQIWLGRCIKQSILWTGHVWPMLENILWFFSRPWHLEWFRLPFSHGFYVLLVVTGVTRNTTRIPLPEVQPRILCFAGCNMEPGNLAGCHWFNQGFNVLHIATVLL
jgi:hypothetical protein